MTSNPLVRLEREGALARIVLARAVAGNAVNLHLARDLRGAVEACEADDGVRAVLLQAEGKAFCVGGDLVEFEAHGERRPDYLAEVAREFHAAQASLIGMRAPVVVAVQGAAAGAGLGLALAGDIVLAGASAHFTLAYTAVGLSADGGSTYLLPRLVGLRRTQELMFTNRRLSAEEALGWGLVTAVTPDSELIAEGEAYALRLAQGPTCAFGVVKALLATSFARDFAGQTEAEGREIARLSGGLDAAEGIAAFREKRRPTFQGRDA